MRQSLMSVIFAAALLFECYALSVALPMGKTDDGPLEMDTFASLLSNEASENDLGDADLVPAGKTRVPRVIVIADPSLWRDLRVLHGGLSIYKRRADDNGQVIGQKDASQELSIPILRRDTMRCMVGRVYRPCWEV
ncbi:pro-melanin-concentrating hormone, like [Anoplopoma fimbria]|uniref:pro-melanin-concentrating hormone, like n=1 Tax=Anoplopoma fimbria TaxID=229290 RepID=UPI0023EA80C5|nr:pro-melanin-concentrating hormone, like [Anoplopoma fimbria]